MEGYGRYWVIIEMLREEADHRLEISASYVRNALAVQMQCDVDAAHKFVQDCIGEFQLFETDGDYFWSNSLLRRMDLRKARSEQARQAAMARWEGKKKSGKNADAMRLQCDRNAIKGKERKVKIKEGKKNKYCLGHKKTALKSSGPPTRKNAQKAKPKKHGPKSSRTSSSRVRYYLPSSGPRLRPTGRKMAANSSPTRLHGLTPRAGRMTTPRPRPCLKAGARSKNLWRMVKMTRTEFPS